MKYSTKQIIDLKGKLIQKINNEIDIAFENDNMDYILEKYGLFIEDEDNAYLVHDRMKILVIGALSGNVKDYQMAAKKFGISEYNVEFVGYDEAKRFSTERLRYSSEYSDIIYGPLPHKMKDMGDCSSLIARMEQNPSEYPKVFRATNGNDLKITISIFKNILTNTRFFVNNCLS